ncbi:hypothetical protein DPMN_152731 [Dreissena polymorpha]|uniref:Uncharacterized protein n=1 Tax=Dreissena polymorpha TaxID=45954 RepID=A0A9D4FNJ5_DREPO|nr:hypothetical protein DPMN_152731 [Dreissena polymorpha]
MLQLVFQQTRTVLELGLDLIQTNLLSIFGDDWSKTVSVRINTTLSSGGYVFKGMGAIFEHSLDIIRANVLSNCHEDFTTNITSRALTGTKIPPPGCHVFNKPYFSKTIALKMAFVLIIEG